MTQTAKSRPHHSSPGENLHPFRYTAELAHSVEIKWQARWEKDGTFVVSNPGQPEFDETKPKFFCLDMFPYPSGAGLHVGHPVGYIATDIVSRYQRHKGCNVLHPMGWDAFGLPAEQYAIQTGIHPAVTTIKAIDTFRSQIKRFGLSYDWTREFATTDPDYYKWTQWIWLKAYHSWYDPKYDKARSIEDLIKVFECGHDPTGVLNGRNWKSLGHDEQRKIIDDHRLAYLDEQMVNWCPKLGTALANEEVIDGKSERGAFPVYRRPLKQWMFRITAYAERLLKDLDLVEWPESTRTMQAEWIGRSEGAEIDFPTEGQSHIRVFTTRPDTLFGATFMVLAPEHRLVTAIIANPLPETEIDKLRDYVEAAKNRSDVDRQSDSKEKTGVFTGAYATNPATKKKIPIWVADYVLMGYGHGAIMAVPGQDGRDWDFAKAFNLPIIRTVKPPDDFGDEPYIEDGPAINSGFLDGLYMNDAKARVIDWLETEKIGRRKINYKLRDWLFSRQRYWGEPFPIVIDENGNHYPVDESKLPVLLPELKDYKPVESDDPAPLLAKATDWMNTTAGDAGVSPDVLPADTKVKRETNTMPGWAGSCWYYLRYCDPRNGNRFVGHDQEKYWMTKGVSGVNLYIGGAEHAVLHLLYARFWHKILYDLGEVSTKEPFAKLFHQGLITAFSYQRSDKSLVPADEVRELDDGQFVEASTDQPVSQIIAKMSKSLRNVVNPDDVIAEYGADTFRLYEMYMGPLEQSKPWNPRDIEGPYRFLARVWRLVVDEQSGDLKLRDDCDQDVEKQLHRTIAKVQHDIENLSFNTAIAAMIEFVNTATKAGGVSRDQLKKFAVVLSPFAPHIAEELWAKLGQSQTIVFEPWPKYDQSLLQDENIELPVQIMGKIRGRITVPSNADEATIEQTALSNPSIVEQLEGKTVRKIVVVPGRIVNIVAN